MLRNLAELKRYVTACIAVSLFFTFSQAFCQTPLPPEGSLADKEEERLLKEPAEKKAPQPPKVEIEEKVPQKPPPGPEATVKFFIKKIAVEGSTVFTQEELAKITTPYESKELSLNDLNLIADKITENYQKRGYITSRAYIPPQKISEGIAVIKIFEGKLGEIKLQGNKFFSEKFITYRFKPLKGKILKQDALRKVLLALNQNPDLQVKAALEAGKAPETTDMLLQASDRNPQHLSYEFNNLGDRLTGHYRHIISYTNTNLMNVNDLLLLQFPWAADNLVWGVSGAYILPLNDRGTKVGVKASSLHVKLVKEYDPSNVKSVSGSASIYGQQTLFDFETLSGDGVIGFEGINSTTKSLGQTIISNKVRVLNLGLNFNEEDKYGRANLTSALDIGFPDSLGASGKNDPMGSPRGSGGNFTIYKLTLTRLQILPFSSMLIFNCESQYSSYKLPGPKRFFVGGAYSVRGYPESNSTGDFGVNVTNEVRTPCFIIPKALTFKGKKVKDFFQFAFFTDIAANYDRTNNDNNAFLAGSGLGLRLNAGQNVTGRVDIAWPIGDEASDEKEDNYRIHFSVALKF
jgi:hemolysin activation/secretion protein